MHASKNPVVLIHGISDTHQKMRHIQSHLEMYGYKTFAIDLVPSDGSATLEELALQLTTFIEEKLSEFHAFDIVTFSMGGIVARQYLQNTPNQVKRFISISSPHNGTYMAYLSRKVGSKQLRPDSSFLRKLNQSTSKLAQIKCISIRTPLDLMIVPSSSSKVRWANNKIVWSILHPFMVRNKACLRIIAQSLQ